MVRGPRRPQPVRGSALSAKKPDLHPSLLPISFLIGSWRGEGVGGYEGMDGFRFGQELTFAADGARPALAYRSRTWWTDEPRDGREVNSPLAREVGWWRVTAPSDEGPTVEVTLAHPFGIAEVYVGSVAGTRIDLSSNVVIRTATARQVDRSQRLYGIVEGDLAYAIDMAAEGKEMQSHLSARLSRVTSTMTTEMETPRAVPPRRS